ncbi:MAG: radical SAM protein [Methanothrix sp.]|jgi:wyosine [tRNA(Phe)-imidazoG37] synthetase (radical SAM superfamily)|nr:radical SAM protein [Methanothrix sp.]
MIAFGPVPSRRLGRSLGINNIPAKICSYSCAYCQVGKTLQMEVKRRSFYSPLEIYQEVKEKVDSSQSLGHAIDYLTFVPDGEPTLDTNLGQEIDMLRSLGIRIAVISNASLIWNENVREELSKADWVSVKVDVLDERIWRRMDRPHRALQHEAILQGILEFAKDFKGTLVTESMLLASINDDENSLQVIAEFLEKVDPAVAYISVPTRPPAEKWATMPSEESICQAYQIFCSRVKHVELLVGYEGDSFDLTGNVESDILSIAAVHPMREAAVEKFLQQSRESWELVQRLIDQGKLIKTEYMGNNFYLRRPQRQN